jgi:hypothetical protein
MNTKTLAVALALVVVILAASATYALAHPTGPGYYGITENTPADDEWWDEMQAYMEEHWQDHEDAGWWQEMREHMEQRWADAEDAEGEAWWNEMRQFMEEHWEELEDGGYRYGRSSSYGGYGGCHGWRW